MASAENNAESLLLQERQAATLTHFPYSNFHVGAAVRCDDGSVINGCNVENASYGLSIFGERVALFAAITLGKRLIKLAVSGIDVQTNSAPCSRMPCGACRQVIQKFLRADAKIHIDGLGSPAPQRAASQSV